MYPVRRSSDELSMVNRNHGFRFEVSGRRSADFLDNHMAMPTQAVNKRKTDSSGGRRKTIRLDGVCVDGQFVQSISDDGDIPISFDEPSSDPLASLSIELNEIQRRKVVIPSKRKTEFSNFNIKTANSIDASSNPFKRRTMPDPCSFRHLSASTKPNGGDQDCHRPLPSRFCRRCGSSNVQSEWDSAENSCSKAEVWGSRNVDEGVRGILDSETRLCCFTCFFTG